LVLFYKASNRVVLVVAALMILSVPRFVLFATGQGGNLSAAMKPDSVAIKKSEIYYQAFKYGSHAQIFALNGRDGFTEKLGVQFGDPSRGYMTLGYFLLGLYIGRIRFFEQIEEHKALLKKVFKWSGLLLLGLLGFVMVAGYFYTHQYPNQRPSDIVLNIGMSILDFWNFVMTVFYIAGFSLLYCSNRFHQTLNKLTPFGRMALTNYVLQTLIGTFIFCGYGLQKLYDYSNTQVFLISIGVFVFQMVFSKWWLDNFYYGPLEWLWRSLTYLKVQKWRK
jgi:uncharacterized protein